ncbi:protein bunched, class 1/class 3/D/E isoforms [Aplysia californica]|uniref:Protein bunched, class 1/class 3/D/E isoforms n=1 Tax=Aplysia californica TaxID=6500 RepID=A0ABM0ZWL0_APLCA|nr:protein bunched, class 1/class 3/D/E isoforms [Aplysia californica]
MPQPPCGPSATSPAPARPAVEKTSCAITAVTTTLTTTSVTTGPLDPAILAVMRNNKTQTFLRKMDLVKRHLMYAVREEVEILKQQIGEMVERITQLEYENSVLKSEAKPETLNKLVVPRQVTQVTGQPPSATGVVQQLSGVVGGPLSTATPAPSAGGMGVGVVAGSTSVPAQPQQQPQQQQQQGGGVVASAATAAPTSVTVAAGSIPGGVVAQPQAGQPTVVASSQQGTLPPAQQQQQQQSLAAQVQQQQQQQQPPSSQTGQPASQVPAPGSGS